MHNFLVTFVNWEILRRILMRFFLKPMHCWKNFFFRENWFKCFWSINKTLEIDHKFAKKIFTFLENSNDYVIMKILFTQKSVQPSLWFTCKELYTTKLHILNHVYLSTNFLIYYGIFMCINCWLDDGVLVSPLKRTIVLAQSPDYINLTINSITCA